MRRTSDTWNLSHSRILDMSEMAFHMPFPCKTLLFAVIYITSLSLPFVNKHRDIHTENGCSFALPSLSGSAEALLLLHSPPNPPPIFPPTPFYSLFMCFPCQQAKWVRPKSFIGGRDHPIKLQLPGSQQKVHQPHHRHRQLRQLHLQPLPGSS